MEFLDNCSTFLSNIILVNNDIQPNFRTDVPARCNLSQARLIFYIWLHSLPNTRTLDLSEQPAAQRLVLKLLRRLSAHTF